MDISWESWKLFRAALDTGSFSAAAELLGLGQSTLSRRIAALEEAVGHRLFERGRLGLVPTSLAERLRPYAEAMANAEEQARAEVEGFEVEPRGIVRVAMPAGIGAGLLPRMLASLRRRHPELCIEYIADSGVRELSEANIDIAVRSVPPTSGPYLVRRLTEAQLGVYASPDYAARFNPPLTFDELDWIDWGAELTEFPAARWLAERTDRPRVFVSNHSPTLAAAAVAGLGALVYPSVLARLIGLVSLPLDTAGLPAIPFFLVLHRATRSVPRVRAVVEQIEATANALSEGSADQGGGASAQ